MLNTRVLQWLQGKAGALQGQQVALQTRCYTNLKALAAWRAGGPLVLTPPQPYAAQEVLRHLGRDAQNSSEKVVDNTHYRLLYAAPSTLVTLKACFANDQWLLEVDILPEGRTRPKVNATVVRWRCVLRAIHILGLNQPYASFARHAGQYPAFANLLRRWPGLRMVQCASLWEALCWGIVGQQINLAFAYQLRNQLMVRCAENLWGKSTATHGLEALKGSAWQGMLPFPQPQALLDMQDMQWKAARFSRQKMHYLQTLARAFMANDLNEEALQGLDDDAITQRLCHLKGIGPWTAAYALLRGLGRMNAVPVGDAGLRKALKTIFDLDHTPKPEEQASLLESLTPYRGFATTYLWHSLRADP